MNIIYLASADFDEHKSTRKACVVFVVLPPLWYFFIYVLYIGGHQDIEQTRERLIKILVGFLYMLFMQVKVFTGLDRFHRWFTNKYDLDPLRFNLMQLESSYRVQTVIELFSHTLPMMALVSHHSNAVGWTGAGKFAVLIMALMFIKNLGTLTIFVTQKCIDGKEDPDMRPFTGAIKMSKIEMEAVNHIKSYLIDPHDDGMDAHGNTTVHQLMQYE